MALIAILSIVSACEAEPRPDAAEAPSADPPDRPAAATGTLLVEGMPEPLDLRLYRSPTDHALPFTAYVPADMRAEAEGEDEVRFVAAFGGRVEPMAFVHVRALPPGTGRERAEAAARGYKTSRGIPVSQGLEPVADALDSRTSEWAHAGYPFRYQSGGEWFGGRVAVGEHAGRWFLVVEHHPVEYGDGFAPRARLILETWRWADGTPLHASPDPPPPIVEDPPRH